MAQVDTTLSDQGRKMLDSVLDALIPASADGRIPGAGASGVGSAVVSGLSEHSSADLDRAVAYVIAAADADPGARAEALEHSDPLAFEALLRTVYMAYYSRPEIRALFGLSPLPTQPEGYKVSPQPAEMLAELAAPVRRRGPFYREC